MYTLSNYCSFSSMIKIYILREPGRDNNLPIITVAKETAG